MLRSDLQTWFRHLQESVKIGHMLTYLFQLSIWCTSTVQRSCRSLPYNWEGALLLSCCWWCARTPCSWLACSRYILWWRVRPVGQPVVLGPTPSRPNVKTRAGSRT